MRWLSTLNKVFSQFGGSEEPNVGRIKPDLFSAVGQVENVEERARADMSKDDFYQWARDRYERGIGAFDFVFQQTITTPSGFMLAGAEIPIDFNGEARALNGCIASCGVSARPGGKAKVVLALHEKRTP